MAVLTALVAGAQAGDLDLFNPDGLKDPLPDKLSWHGITVYGTVDVGYAYQTNGRPLGQIISDLEYVPFTTTRNFTGQSVSTIQGNALEQSKFGIKIDEEVAPGWTAIGKFDGGFDPMTFTLTDGCHSFLENAGKPLVLQNSNADTSRCGQIFNGVAYGGISNATYGTLTAGRQQSLQLDAIATYDPMALSYAFSLLGYSGTNGGSGSTQAARWNDSVKYIYTYGPFHAAAMYSSGGQDDGTTGNAYAFDVGAIYRGFSIDGVYTKENGAINLVSATLDPVDTLRANISDNEAWAVMAKYTYEFGGGFKDLYDASTLTLFAAYTHIDQNDPSSPARPGTTTNGGYVIVPVNNAFQTTKMFDFYWTGVRYALSSGWSFTGAYYHVDQNSYVSNTGACPGVSASGPQCAGNYDQVSFLVDYEINKHFDVYAGVTYARAAGGLAAQNAGTPSANGDAPKGTSNSVDTTDVVTGIRFRF